MARDLYVSGWLQHEIAALVGVSERTITAWKEKFRWDTLKNADSITIEQTLPRLESALALASAQLESALAEQQPPGGFVDQVVKISNSIIKLKTSSRFADVLDVCKQLCEFSVAEFPEHAEMVRRVADAYVTTKAREQNA